MADKPKKSPLIERTGSLTGDRTLSDLLDQYNLKQYAAPAMAAAVGLPIVGRYVKPVAKAVGKEAARRAGKYVEESGLIPHVIKPEGGNWTPIVENMVSDYYTDDPIVNKWLDTTARKYIIRDLATPSDPIRKLMEQGISHIDPEVLARRAAARENGAVASRNEARTLGYKYPEGFRPQIMAQPNLTGNGLPSAPFDWENLSDYTVNRWKASDLTPRPGMEWLSKLDPNEPVYYPRSSTRDYLGIDQLAKDLEEDIAAGTLRPEQLNKISIGDAVKRSHEKRMAQQRSLTNDLPVAMELPEGYSWRELTHEDPNTLDKILEREGNIMQNCIGGYCEDVYGGASKLYSLRDKMGNPHVNIEVRPTPGGGVVFSDVKNLLGEEKANEMLESGMSLGDMVHMYPELEKHRQYMIKQIKGKQNAAPSEQYIPYVQQFIKERGPFTEIRDLGNAGMLDLARAREHGVFDEEIPGLYRELDRIFPVERGVAGARVLAGQHGVRISPDQMTREVLRNMEGQYTSTPELIQYLQGIEPRPVEHGYSKYWNDLELERMRPIDEAAKKYGTDFPEGREPEINFAEGGAVNYDDVYEFINPKNVNVTPSVNYQGFQEHGGDVKGKAYTYGADLDLLNKMGIGADVRNIDVKYPGGRYKQNELSNLRGRYTTDNDITYAASFSPNMNPDLRSWALRRINPEAGSEIVVERTPRRQYTYNPDEFGSTGPVNVNETPTTWIKYIKNFAEGGEVDYDSMYEFK